MDIIFGNGFHLNFFRQITKDNYLNELKAIIFKCNEWSKVKFENGKLVTADLTNMPFPYNIYQKDGSFAIQILENFVDEIHNTDGIDLENIVGKVFLNSKQYLEQVSTLFPREYTIWKIFCALIVYPFFFAGDQKINVTINKELAEKLNKFDNIFTTNYTNYGWKKIRCLHGKIEDFNNLFETDFILSAKNISKENYFDYLKAWAIKDLEFKKKIAMSIRGESEKQITKNNDVPSKYKQLTLNVFLEKELYSEIKLGSTIALFGLSPFGDEYLISKICNSYNSITVYIFDLIKNFNEREEYERLFKKYQHNNFAFIDSKFF